MPDPVHIFKNIHSMLKKQKIICLPQSVVQSQSLSHPIVKIEHLEKLVQHDNKFELKIARKFKESNLYTKNNHFSSMKVATARSVICRRTAIRLNAYTKTTGNSKILTT